MGCGSSKLDDLPAVALCRVRCSFLDEAIRQRYALANAHIAYMNSLKGVGHSLHVFFENDFGSSPPPTLKGGAGKEAAASKPKVAAHGRSHSDSGSHLHFHSDSDNDSLHHDHSDHSSPLHPQMGHVEYVNTDQGSSMDPFPGSYPGSYPGGYNLQMNYMRKGPAPSISYQQSAAVSETVHVGEMGDSSSSSRMSYMKNKASPSVVGTVGESSSSYNSYPYQNNNSGNGYYAMPPAYGSSSPPPAVASTSKQPPPPPSPPRSSGWDFLNPFESYDRYYAPYTPRRDLKELREEEGIPDLEEEDVKHEVVKEVVRDHKFAGGNYQKAAAEEEKLEEREASHYQTRPIVSEGDEGMEYEVHVVEKKVVDKEVRSEGQANAGASKGFKDDSEVAREIEAQFERASESGNEIAKMLEVGKLPYNGKHVSSKMLHMVTPSLSAVSSHPSDSADSSSNTASAAFSGYEEDIAMKSGNLSSTLQKLLLWEKKLYNEVKAEEKMRVVHDRKCDKLRHLDEKGAESHKIDSTRTLIRDLSTKIRIAIEVVDKISVTLNKIRDEEMWPQLIELIQGLTRMWKSMLDCHHNQCQAIRQARSLGTVGSGKKLSDAHLETTLQLEHELLNWTFRFSSWIAAQKGYVRSLNNWLLRCLLYEPEDTADGRVPFSPGRIGAPLVFVICNQWSQALDIISEKEVVESMRIFAMGVFQLWEQDKLEMRQRMMSNKDLESKVRHLDREDQKIQKEIQAMDKKVVLVSGGENMLSVPVYQSDTSNNSLQASLQRIFEAMERFTADSLKAYEEILQRSEEERLAREHGRVS